MQTIGNCKIRLKDETMKKDISNLERLIIALDLPDIDKAKALVNEIGDSGHFYKIGLELFMTGEYFKLLSWLSDQDKKIFVDLKFFDIPQTVARAVNQLNGKNVHFATVHGNDGMMKAAAQAKDDVKILAVTALTSLDRGDLDDLGFQCNVEDLVVSRAKRALASGCDGVVASGREAELLRNEVDNKLLIVTPGIRPVDNDDDQKRAVTVSQAFTNGADYIVVGRPIKDADSPKKVVEQIQSEIQQTLG